MSKGAQMLVTVGTQLALQGIVKLTTDDPEELDEGQNSLFQGPINNTKSGIPVPLCFGKMEVGGAVINFGFFRDTLQWLFLNPDSPAPKRDGLVGELQDW